MPVLKNPRHEMLAQLLVEGKKHGWTNGACYSRAGYKAEGASAEVNASRLLSNAKNGIAARVQEIVGAGARRAEVTVQSLLEQLDQVLDGAMTEKQFAAARQAIDSKAKLKGLFVDRVEIGGPGEFSSAQSFDEMIDVLMADCSSPRDLIDLLHRMAAAVEAKIANEAQLVVAKPRPSEASQALALLRPGKVY
jgi:hypothetical protein